MPREKWGFPDFPDLLTYLWEHFINLHNTRSMGMALNPISYTEIEAYSRLMKIQLSKFDIAAIKRLDIIAMNVINAPQDKKG